MPDNSNDKRTDGLDEETTPFHDSCQVPAIAQVDAPADLQNGIVEIPNKDIYIDEP